MITRTEQQWCEWLGRLESWQRRRVFKHEVQYHDDWMDGLDSFSEILERAEARVDELVTAGPAWDYDA